MASVGDYLERPDPVRQVLEERLQLGAERRETDDYHDSTNATSSAHSVAVAPPMARVRDREPCPAVDVRHQLENAAHSPSPRVAVNGPA